MFAAAAILSLALGIGANAAIFQLIDAVGLQSLAIANPHELAEVRADGVDAFGVSDDFNSEITFPLWRRFARISSRSPRCLPGGAPLSSLVAVRTHDVRGLWVSGRLFPRAGRYDRARQAAHCR